MKGLKLVACAVVAIAGAVMFGTSARDSAAVAAAQQDAVASPEVTTLAKEWAAALEKGEVDWMKPMLADGYVYVNPRGQATDGAALLKQLKDRSVSIKVSPKERQFRLHHDAVVMFGLCDITGEVDGKRVDGAYRFVDVFQRKDGKWLAVASTLTRVQAE